MLSAEDRPWPSDAVNCTYANRLRTRMTVAMPSGPTWTQSYAYDFAKPLTSASSLAGTLPQLTYTRGDDLRAA